MQYAQEQISADLAHSQILQTKYGTLKLQKSREVHAAVHAASSMTMLHTFYSATAGVSFMYGRCRPP